MQKNSETKTIQIKLILIGLLSAILILSVVLILRKKAEAPAAATASAAVSATPEASVSAAPEISAAPIVSPRYEKQAYAPITVDNTTGFVSGWASLLNNSNATVDFAYDSMHADVINGGAGSGDVKIYREGIPFIQKVTYTLSFYASSSVNRNITAVISSEEGQLASQSFALTGDTQLFQLSFDMSAATTWNGHVEFDLGSDGSSTADEHTIDLTVVRITPSAWNYGVKTNQVGYQTNDEKRCTFSYDAGDVFDVVNADTGAVVYSGAIVNKAADDATGETDCWGDFTNVTAPGTYLIRTQIGVSSYTFSIGDQIYDDLSSRLLKMLSLQRCGENLDSSWAGSLAHGQCHTALATVYGSSDTRDVTGGWHDAGDYGRYVKTGAKAVSDLLFAYLYDTNAFTDGTGTVQAGNNVADLLDESRYELEWMLKMQDTDGGVFNKVLTPGIADTVLPDQDNQPLYVLETETTSTADFGGTMAVAAIAYKTVDPDFSKKCLDAAEKAETYLNNNPNLYDKKNPSDIVGGEYLDNTDTDGRFYTEMALWVATGDSSYLDNAKAVYEKDDTADKGISWSTNGGYGRYLFLMQPGAENLDSDFYDTMKKSLQEEADVILGLSGSSGYNASIDSYVWGSNGNISDNGITLTMAYDATGKQEYRQAAMEQVSYLLGRNSLDTCFVSGFGSKYPKNVHSRIAKVNDAILLGALVGGPDASREDPVAQALPAETASAKVYADSFDSYSTNEISIYWNASLIHLLAKLR